MMTIPAVALRLLLASTVVMFASSRAPLITLDQLPLSTSSRWIVDKKGKRVKWSCVNWSGADQRDGVPGGLQHADISAIAGLISEWGFNCVRIPWSVWMALENPVVTRAMLFSANRNFTGMSALGVLDHVVSACAKENLMVILDNHMSDGDWCCSETDRNGLWYTDRWPESAWQNSLMKMAERYKSEPYVVAIELRNELRGTTVAEESRWPTWATGSNQTDWHAAAKRAGNAILQTRPQGLLIVVDGLAYSTDLTGVAKQPLDLHVPHRVVYSAHDYFWPMYNGLTKEQLFQQLDTRWGYILKEGQPYTAPVWVSEFGEWHDGRNHDHGWWPNFLAFLEEKDLDFAYWRIDGTESNGTSRMFGAEAGFGIMNESWSGPAFNGRTLSALQKIQTPTQGPLLQNSASDHIIMDDKAGSALERWGHHHGMRPAGLHTAQFIKG